MISCKVCFSIENANIILVNSYQPHSYNDCQALLLKKNDKLDK